MATTPAHSGYSSFNPQLAIMSRNLLGHGHVVGLVNPTVRSILHAAQSRIESVADGPGSVVVEGRWIVGLGSGSGSDRIGSGSYDGWKNGWDVDGYVWGSREAGGKMVKLDNQGSLGRAVIMGYRHYDSFVRDGSDVNTLGGSTVVQAIVIWSVFEGMRGNGETRSGDLGKKGKEDEKEKDFATVGNGNPKPLVPTPHSIFVSQSPDAHVTPPPPIPSFSLHFQCRHEKSHKTPHSARTHTNCECTDVRGSLALVQVVGGALEGVGETGSLGEERRARDNRTKIWMEITKREMKRLRR
ncbi:hypothetical protein BJ165DRAFT_1598390 [Panaeolus papilionaceus]|nr:hypothetical protein BJ165DRAFT_1598390 [Panaeolus papilionaceus]